MALVESGSTLFYVSRLQGILLEHDLDGTGARGGRGSRGGHGLNLASEFGGSRDVRTPCRLFPPIWAERC